MNNAGLPCTYQEGEKGQFELFFNDISYLKGDDEIPGVSRPVQKFFTFKDVQSKRESFKLFHQTTHH
jgi:hypothetical protein